MGRIRTVKPELFTSEKLYDLEVETGFPIRTAFIGMFCQADREGRFKWRPRMLKSQVLPYDDLDFSRVLDALESRGFLETYTVNEEKYGLIPKFLVHQFINNKEQASTLPEPEKDNKHNILTREEREGDALESRGVKERKGKEGKGSIKTNPSFISKEVPSKKEESTTEMSSPSEKTKEKNRVSKDFKSYDEKIKIVESHYQSLSPGEKQKFYNGALHHRPFGTPAPERESMAEKILLMEWYDETVENKSPQNQNARNADI